MRRIAVVAALTAGGCAGGPRDHLRDWPATDADGHVHAVIEIPAGSCDKWEVGLDGVLRRDRENGRPRSVRYLPYPANYGIVPRAVLGTELGGDGDPLDIVVLGPAVARGTLLAVHVLGTIRLVDAGEKDDKLVAVPVGSALAHCRTIDELERSFAGIATILATWFENYKGRGALQCGGFGPPDEARALLQAARRSFERLAR